MATSITESIYYEMSDGNSAGAYITPKASVPWCFGDSTSGPTAVQTAAADATDTTSTQALANSLKHIMQLKGICM
jgi:hypothetical protein